MNITSHLVCWLFVLVTSFGCIEAMGAEKRVWTSKTGSSITAHFLDVTNSYVVLSDQKENKHKIHFDDLSDVDQQIVRDEVKNIIDRSIIMDGPIQKPAGPGYQVQSFTKNGKTYYGKDAQRQMVKMGRKLYDSGIAQMDRGNIDGGMQLHDDGSRLINMGFGNPIQTLSNENIELTRIELLDRYVNKLPNQTSSGVMLIKHKMHGKQKLTEIEYDELQREIADEYIRQKR